MQVLISYPIVIYKYKMQMQLQPQLDLSTSTLSLRSQISYDIVALLLRTHATRDSYIYSRRILSTLTSHLLQQQQHSNTNTYSKLL